MPLPAPGWPTEAVAAASRLFSPVTVGPTALSSRTWVPAMVTWRAGPQGQVTDDLVAWYAALAQGRPGALVVEAAGVGDVPSGPLLRIHEDGCIPGLRRVTEAVKRASEGQTRVFVQLIDFENPAPTRLPNGSLNSSGRPSRRKWRVWKRVWKRVWTNRSGQRRISRSAS